MQDSPWYRALKQGDPVVVRRLLSSGCDPNERWSEFGNPLIVAAARGNTPVLRLLLEAGARPTSYAVQVAAFGNHAKAVRILIEAGAAVDPGRGQLPLLNALKFSGRSREELSRVRQMLREAGGRELPEWYLRWRWAIRHGWRWRLRRLAYSLGWRPRTRGRSN
jgi:hypothetical protein